MVSHQRPDNLIIEMHVLTLEDSSFIMLRLDIGDWMSGLCHNKPIKKKKVHKTMAHPLPSESAHIPLGSANPLLFLSSGLLLRSQLYSFMACVDLMMSLGHHRRWNGAKKG